MRKHIIKIDGELMVTNSVFNIAMRLLRDAVNANGLRFSPKGRRLYVQLWADYLETDGLELLNAIADDILASRDIRVAVDERPINRRIKRQTKFYIIKSLSICLQKLQNA